IFVDTGIASATGLLDLETLQWHPGILKFAGITAEQLPELVSPKYTFTSDTVTEHLSIPAGTVIVAGGSDGGMANLGSGATDQQTMAITIGTSGAARIIVDGIVTDPGMRIFCYHLKDNYYFTGGANNNGAVVLQWMKEMLFATEGSFDDLFEHAATAGLEKDGPLFLPYILGERAPIWNSNAKGVFFGLTINHSKSSMVRAAMEGVVFCLYSIGKILLEKRSVTAIQASGGFARSALWLQILADVFNIKVNVAASVESSALGAVLLGKEAVNVDAVFEHKIAAVYEPSGDNHIIYQEKFARFERIYELLKAEME
ncbi:MAG: carbohydrate kinase, partial [Chitinophagaceae bacterium]|nr:carbohydrate kinase [Chitinophagaceae bacterium]